MYVCMYVCMYLCICVCVYLYTYISIKAHERTLSHEEIKCFASISVNANAYVSTPLSLSVSMHAFKHTHTHTHTQSILRMRVLVWCVSHPPHLIRSIHVCTLVKQHLACLTITSTSSLHQLRVSALQHNTGVASVQQRGAPLSHPTHKQSTLPKASLFLVCLPHCQRQ